MQLLKRKYIHLLAFLLISLSSIAKESHFSQFYALPVTLNPALTGITGSDYRLAGIYRSQWAGFSPILTQALSFERYHETNTKPNPLRINKIGYGALIVQDQGGTDAGIRTTSGYFSCSDYIDLGRMYLSVGGQIGYVTRYLFGTTTFDDQYDNASGELKEYIPSIDHLRLNYKINFVDANAGLLAIFKMSEENNNTIMLGAAAYHITMSEENFIRSTIIPQRYVAHTGGRFKLSTASPISLVPSAIYMRVQDALSVSQEYNVGMDIEYDFSQENNAFEGMISGGGYIRPGDALIVHGALSLNNFLVGFSYDINISGLRSATNLDGGFELSLRFEPEPKRRQKRMIQNPCPVI